MTSSVPNLVCHVRCHLEVRYSVTAKQYKKYEFCNDGSAGALSNSYSVDINLVKTSLRAIMRSLYITKHGALTLRYSWNH